MGATQLRWGGTQEAAKQGRASGQEQAAKGKSTEERQQTGWTAALLRRRCAGSACCGPGWLRSRRGTRSRPRGPHRPSAGPGAAPPCVSRPAARDESWGRSTRRAQHARQAHLLTTRQRASTRAAAQPEALSRTHLPVAAADGAAVAVGQHVGVGRGGQVVAQPRLVRATRGRRGAGALGQGGGGDAVGQARLKQLPRPPHVERRLARVVGRRAAGPGGQLGLGAVGGGKGRGGERVLGQHQHTRLGVARGRGGAGLAQRALGGVLQGRGT